MTMIKIRAKYTTFQNVRESTRQLLIMTGSGSHFSEGSGWLTPRRFQRPHELDKIQKNSRNTLFWVRILMIIIGTNHHFPLWYGMHFTSFGLCRQDTTQVEFVVDVTLKWEIQAPGHKMCRPYLPFRVRHQKGRYAPRKWPLNEIMQWYWYATLWENQGQKTILWPPKERVQINRYGT